MKAAVVLAPGRTPVYGVFESPRDNQELALVSVSAAALSTFSKSRSTGRHYSAQSFFPAVAGAEGVGTLEDRSRVYFVLPEAPYGALAEYCLVDPSHCVPIPDELDDVTAAALANPGMSAWAALAERAALKPGETVLVNGATGSAGRLAVFIAKHLGAGRVIATGRNTTELASLKQYGADIAIPFELDRDVQSGSDAYEAALAPLFAQGVDVVIDYLWGTSAKTIIAAIARNAEYGGPVRFVNVGAAAGDEAIPLPSAALRSSAIELMGSGLKSVPFARLLEAVRQVFEVGAAGMPEVPKRVMCLSKIEEAWQAPGSPRIVIRP